MYVLVKTPHRGIRLVYHQIATMGYFDLFIACGPDYYCSSSGHIRYTHCGLSGGWTGLYKHYKRSKETHGPIKYKCRTLLESYSYLIIGTVRLNSVVKKCDIEKINIRLTNKQEYQTAEPSALYGVKRVHYCQWLHNMLNSTYVGGVRTVDGTGLLQCITVLHSENPVFAFIIHRN